MSVSGSLEEGRQFGGSHQKTKRKREEANEYQPEKFWKGTGGATFVVEKSQTITNAAASKGGGLVKNLMEKFGNKPKSYSIIKDFVHYSVRSIFIAETIVELLSYT